MKEFVQLGVVLVAMLFFAACREKAPATVEQFNDTNTATLQASADFAERMHTISNWCLNPSQPLIIHYDYIGEAERRSEWEKKYGPDRRLAKLMADDFMASQPDAQNYEKSGVDGLSWYGAYDLCYWVDFAPKTPGTREARVRVGIESARRQEEKLIARGFQLRSATNDPVAVLHEFLRETKSLSDFCAREY